ncbi:MAG: hypothetical protein HGB19_09605 [Chlorobiales bacterium]|nr:hypothetical protein [Chlorobiales bacterium]
MQTASFASEWAFQDSLLLPPAPPSDSLKIVKKSDRMSPWQVSLWSAVLPGFGQVYNNSYWKLPIYYGLMGWFGYNVIQQHDKYVTYRDRYLKDQTGTTASSNRSYRDFYKKSRNEYIIYLCLTYLAGIVDAYVDAHLYDFEVSEDLSNHPYPNNESVQLVSFKIKF